MGTLYSNNNNVSSPTVRVGENVTNFKVLQAGGGEPLRLVSTNEAGKMVFVTSDGNLIPSCDNLIKLGQVVQSQSELDDLTAGRRLYSSTEIMNRWTRAAHLQSTAFQPSDAQVLQNNWNVNENGLITSVADRPDYLTFISNNRYDNYNLEVEFSSTSADDDLVSVVLAYFVDPVTNIQHTLSLIRSPNGIGPIPRQQNTPDATIEGLRWAVVYNLGHYTGRIAQERTQILINSSANVTAQGNWSTTGACRVKVTRLGNSFTCETTQLGSTTYNNTQIQFSLNDNTVLEKFKGAKPFGFGVVSQATLSINILNFKDLSLIYNVTDNTFLTINAAGTITQTVPASLFQTLGPYRYLYDQYTQKTFYILKNDEVRSQFQRFTTANQNPINGTLEFKNDTSLTLTSFEGTSYSISVTDYGDLITTQI